jgi:putative oxidoreductase
MESEMNKLSIGLRILVALVFVFQGLMKVAGVQNEWRDHLEVAPWFWIITGTVQLLGAAGLIASLRWERLALPSAAIFMGIMIGALAAHVRISDPISHMLFPLVMLLASAGIVWIHYRRDRSDASGAVTEVGTAT